MTSTEKELARGGGYNVCSHGNGDMVGCQACQDMVAAFWALIDPTVSSPLRWDGKLGEYVERV